MSRIEVQGTLNSDPALVINYPILNTPITPTRIVIKYLVFSLLFLSIIIRGRRYAIVL